MITDVARLQIRVDSLEVQLADQRLRDLQRSGKVAEGGMGALYASTKKLAGVLGGAYLGHKLLMSGFENIRSAEKLNAMLITATGSAEGAKIAMSDLSKLAIETPFSLENLTEAFIKLKNLGLDPSEEALISYGETASSMGKGIEDIIRAIAGASVGEFEALKAFGIKAKIEGDKISLLFGGVKTTIENNAEAIQRYMINLGNTKFAGSMALQMDTINGKLSNLGDAWFQFSDAVADSGLGSSIAKALGVPTAALEAATLKIREAQLDLERATTADIAVIESLIARNEVAIFAGRNAPIPSGPSAYNPQMDALIKQRQNERLQAKLAELKALKEEQAQQAELVALEQRRQRGHETVIDFLEKRERARRIEMGDEAILTELWAERVKLQRDMLEGEAGSPDAAVARLAGIVDQIEKLNETIEKNTEKERERLETVTDFLKTEQELRREAYEERRQIVLDTVKDEQEAAKLISQLNRKEFSDKLKDARGFFDDLQELSGGGNEKIFRAQKALALATATIDGVMAVQKAATAFAFPYNIPGIAVETARAAASVAAISATEFSGAYADGGDPPVGKVALVGERGPELFIPKTAGTIIPNHKLGDSSGGIVVKIENHNVQTEVTQTQDDQGRQMLVLRNSIKREVKAEVARELNEGVGQVASGFNVAYTRNRKGGS